MSSYQWACPVARGRVQQPGGVSSRPSLGGQTADSAVSLQGQQASGKLNGHQLWNQTAALAPESGWVAVGTGSFELAQFDDFAVVAE